MTPPFPPSGCPLEPPAPDEIQVWCWPLDGGRPLPAEALGSLSAAEQTRMARFVFERDRRRYGAAHLGVRRLLGAVAQLDPAALEFVANRFGKPSLAPGQAPDLAFNLSHSGGWAALAIARGPAVGVDIEQLRAHDPALPDRVFAPEERAEWLSLPQAERSLGFFHGWTRKEAHVKAVGQGLTIPLDSFAVTLAPGAPAVYRRIGRDPGEAAAWQIRSFVPALGLVGAVTTRRTGWRVVLRPVGPP